MIGKDAVATVPKPTSLDDVPLDSWKELNADGVIVGTVAEDGGGHRRAGQADRRDSRARRRSGSEYSGSIANPRRYAHTISDEMFKQQLGLDGVARTQAGVLVRPPGRADQGAGHEPRHPGDLHRRLRRREPAARDQHHDAEHRAGVVARQAGDRLHQLAAVERRVVRRLPGHHPVLHHDRRTRRRRPTAARTSRITCRPGRRTGSKLAFTTNRDGNPEIYVMNKDGSGLRRMTNNPAIDVSPTWSPNGNQLAWVSDRTGNPKIYIMNADGTGQRTAGRRSVLGSPDLVARQVQRDRLCGAQRARLRHQDLQLRHRRGDAHHRRHRQQREPGVLAQRPSHRVHLDPQRQGPALHGRSRRE